MALVTTQLPSGFTFVLITNGQSTYSILFALGRLIPKLDDLRFAFLWGHLNVWKARAEPDMVPLEAFARGEKLARLHSLREVVIES